MANCREHLSGSPQVSAARKLRHSNAPSASEIHMKKILLLALLPLVGCFLSLPASSLPANEYLPYHPTGCRYVRKSPNGKFSFVQTCSRGPTGEWEQVIDAMELVARGVIYIPRQTLINGIDVEGYWCSGAAPRAFKDTFQRCTKTGWQKAKQSP